MSHRIFTLALLLFTASPALAYRGPEVFDLPHCGGRATIYRNERETVVKLDDVDDCSNVTVNGQRTKMDLQYNDRYSYVYTWHPTFYRDQLVVRVHSNSFKTDDAITVRADEYRPRGHWDRPGRWPAPAPAPVVTVREDRDLIYLDETRNTAYLPDCGGRLSIELNHQQLLVRIDNSRNCDRVRLTVFNQQPLVMESVRRLDRDCRVWAFSLPERSVRPGRNSLTLAVGDSRQDRNELVRYYFSDQRWFYASGGR